MMEKEKSRKPQRVSHLVDTIFSERGVSINEAITKLTHAKKLNAKEGWKKLKLKLTMREVDEWGHMESVVEIWGERLETPEEVERRVDYYLSRRFNDLFKYEQNDGYWNSPDGVKEAAVLRKWQRQK